MAYYTDPKQQTPGFATNAYAGWPQQQQQPASSPPFGTNAYSSLPSKGGTSTGQWTGGAGTAVPDGGAAGGGGAAGMMGGGHDYTTVTTKAPGEDPPLAGPGYQEDFYKQHGQDLLNDPSASEQLFAEGVKGSNPFYDYAQQQTIKAINDQSAARGNFNSSYTMRNIGNAVADLRGQQAHELGQLAGQADSGKFGRYDRSNQYAGDAQDQLQARMNAGVNAYTGLADKQADQVHGFYDSAGKEMSQADMAAIELQLKQAGMTTEEIQSFLSGMSQLGGTAVKAFG